MSTATLLELRQDFWVAAFRNGTRCGAMRAGPSPPLPSPPSLVLFFFFSSFPFLYWQASCSAASLLSSAAFGSLPLAAWMAW